MGSNREGTDDLETSLREVQDELFRKMQDEFKKMQVDMMKEIQKVKFEMMDGLKSLQKTLNRMVDITRCLKADCERARSQDLRVDTVTNLQVLLESQELVKLPLKRSAASPPKRRQAQTVPNRRRHHTARTRKRHRYGRKGKMTRTWKKMKKVSRAEMRKKQQGKKPMTEVLACRQRLPSSEATWKDEKAFLRTLRTRFMLNGGVLIGSKAMNTSTCVVYNLVGLWAKVWDASGAVEDRYSARFYLAGVVAQRSDRLLFLFSFSFFPHTSSLYRCEKLLPASEYLRMPSIPRYDIGNNGYVS
ncbi:hypothetical protein ISN44_As13g016820 [Arabidopsis suecica]|uniref:Uncharacterized protein n=1 Tax=Arabidopsis suecica TaxID=45249 RepID=A0A8T1XUM7_ARASU|nr:hypothetical protein ISN44_As13g016820 [Arabidopsis suecica]